MAMMKYGSANIVEPCINQDHWAKSKEAWKVECDEKGCRIKTAKTVIAKYSPEKYLLSHATIIAAVETELANKNNPKSDYYIHPAYSKFVNNNGDAWSKKMLSACYRTFIGADNFMEHVQIKELSKGKVIDAVLREVSIGKDKKGEDLTTYYVDILVATERKHKDLVAKIESGEIDKMSMGCFTAGTEITLANGTKRNIEEIQLGDLVITHKGNIKPVMHIQKRWHDDVIHALKVEGDQKTTYVTSEHPFWAFNKKCLCACGCGEEIKIRLRGDQVKDNIPVFSQYKVGHYARIINPNKKMYSLNDYKLLKENNPIQKKLNLSWIEAKDLNEGDLVSYPISKTIINSDDATIEKARLLGYFLAEGSFVKEMVVEGEENDYGIRCRICGGIYNMIGTHLPVHKINQEEYLRLYPGAPTKAKIDKKLIRTKSRLDDLNVDGLKRNRKKVGVEFSLGSHEKNTLNREISELAAKVFPNATILQYDTCIKIIGIEAAVFFEKYCGEYFNNKILPQEVLYWDPAIQRHLIATWIIGDLNCTGSKNLANQFKFILNRLKILHSLYKSEAKLYQTDIKKMTADGTIVSNHYEGIRSESYMIQLSYQGFNTLSKELNHSFKFKMPSKYKDISDHAKNIISKNWKNSHQLDSIVRPITEISTIPYQGWVYNFSVKDDESYIANDIAVHNCKVSFTICSKCGNKAVDETDACEHVRYEKNNIFYDEGGIQRKVAELCGHFDEPESVTFIDASWVAHPAFTGAVKRNVVNPPENIMAKIEEANKKESYEYQMGDYLKVAQAKEDKPEEDTPEETPKEEAPAEDTPSEETPKEEAPAEDTPPEDTPVPEEAPEDQNSAETWKKKIKNRLLEEIGNEIVQDFNKEPEEGGPRELETLDDTLIQPTASIPLKQMWVMKNNWTNYLEKCAGNLDKKAFDKLKYGTFMLLTSNDLSALKDYGYNRRDFLAVMSFLDKRFKDPLSLKIKKALLEFDSTEGLNPEKALFAIQKTVGRKLNAKESKKALVWLRAMDSYPI